MAKLGPDTHVLLDAEVKVYLRPNSKRWQATFKVDEHRVRISTGKRDLEEAKTVAREQFLDYKYRAKHDLPIITKRFEDVAKLAFADMKLQLPAKTTATRRKVKKVTADQRKRRTGMSRKPDFQSSPISGPFHDGRPRRLSERNAVNQISTCKKILEGT